MLRWGKRLHVTFDKDTPACGCRRGLVFQTSPPLPHRRLRAPLTRCGKLLRHNIRQRIESLSTPSSIASGQTHRPADKVGNVPSRQRFSPVSTDLKGKQPSAPNRRRVLFFLGGEKGSLRSILFHSQYEIGRSHRDGRNRSKGGKLR